MYNLKIIVASTRPGRKGRMVADWFAALIKAYEEFQIEVVDLKEINLPEFDEPAPPKTRQYLHEHTKRWSEKIDQADAFVIVTCEYNHGFSGPLKNAIDYLFYEWNYKPAAFVGYGGISGGTRSVQMLSQVLTSLRVVSLFDAVNIPFINKFIEHDERFVGNEAIVKSVHMMHELLLWTMAMKDMRNSIVTTKVNK